VGVFAYGSVGRRLGGLVGGVGDALASVFFPGGCRLCERLLTRASRLPICDECLAAFPVLPARVCGRCGSPSVPGALDAVAAAGSDSTPAAGDSESGGTAGGGRSSSELLCGECIRRTYAFESARSYAEYRGALVRAILLLKFERIDPLAAYFAERVVWVAERDDLTADIVVPVPLHRERQRERGYNQADLISRQVAKRMKLPHKPVLLMRTKARPDKHILSYAERWRVVRGAFATRPGSQVDNKRVLLLDDVVTSGATLDACAKALLKAGAKSVVGLTVARAAKRAVTPGLMSKTSEF
jgi:ComF family protein